MTFSFTKASVRLYVMLKMEALSAFNEKSLYEKSLLGFPNSRNARNMMSIVSSKVLLCSSVKNCL